MRMNRRELATGALSLAAGTALSSFAAAEDGFVPFEGIEEFAVATDAYIYGYPLLRGRQSPNRVERQHWKGGASA